MKNVILALLILTSNAEAAEEIFYLPVPDNVASVNGSIITNGKIIAVRTTDPKKYVYTHENHFIVYNLTKDPIKGEVLTIIDVPDGRFEIDIDMVCADHNAMEIKTNGYYEKRWTYSGVRKQLKEL